MKLYYSPKSRLHDPLYEINNGEKVNHPENAQRVAVIINALNQEGFEVEEINSNIRIRDLKRVHSQEFINSLQRISNSLRPNEVLYPDVFLRERVRSRKSVLALAGQYSFDVYTPVLEGTYEAALGAAGLALRAAKDLATEHSDLIYALTHPIGHHALPDKMGGYSYFNNAAIAAEYLSGFGKVAILDLDFHHGNGTQEIFYQRSDVLFVSLHADPRFKFPYYYGYKEEIGEGQGLGFNVNYPLPIGTDAGSYQPVLEKAVNKIRKFKPNFLVISLGFDTHENDPIGGFKLTTAYYQKAAVTIKSLNLPTIIIQEGGYDIASLGNNVVNFLKGYK